MMSWASLTPSTTHHFILLIPMCRRSKYGPASFRQKISLEPENVCTYNFSYKGLSVPFPLDRPSSDSNLSQIYTVMGRKAPTAKELLEEATARGYQLGAHREKDVMKEIPKYVQKTIKDQNWTLNRYVKYVLLQLWHLNGTLLSR